MSLRPERLREFAQRSRDVVLTSAITGVVTGLVVAGCEWLQFASSTDESAPTSSRAF